MGVAAFKLTPSRRPALLNNRRNAAFMRQRPRTIYHLPDKSGVPAETMQLAVFISERELSQLAAIPFVETGS